MGSFSLLELESMLKDSGFDVKKMGKEAQLPMDQLVVPMASDYKERELLLQMHCIEEQVPLAFNNMTQYSFIHFFMALPFQIQEEAFADSSRLSSLINKICLLPGFGVSETDKVITYHYVHTLDAEKMRPETLHFIMGSVAHMMDLFLPTFEEVGVKKRSYHEIVEEAKCQAEQNL